MSIDNSRKNIYFKQPCTFDKVKKRHIVQEDVSTSNYVNYVKEENDI